MPALDVKSPVSSGSLTGQRRQQGHEKAALTRPQRGKTPLRLRSARRLTLVVARRGRIAREYAAALIQLLSDTAARAKQLARTL